MWRTLVLRKRQSLALSTIFENKACDGTLLFVDCTGGGKSHIMRVTGTCVRGIIVVTAPTLALAAFKKFKVADKSTGFVDAIHFDEDIGTDDTKRLDLITDLSNIKRHTNRTVFPFISPQKLAKYADLRSTLLACNAKKTMRMLLIDEFHIHCQHGMDFRREIKQVCNEFVRPLMKRETSTYLLASTQAFRQRNLRMTFEIGDNFTSKCASKVVEFTKSNPDPAYAVFTNTAVASIKIHSAIEDALDSAGLFSDVVLVHGSLSLEEKFHLCHAFCDISTQSKSKSKSNTNRD
jgi:hypothetical protein